MARTEIGFNVRRRRTVAGLSQRQLAERIGKSREFVSQLEHGKPLDKQSTLIALATALNCDIIDLTGQPYPPTAHADLALIAAVPLIRTALDDPEGEPPEPRSLRELDLDTDRAMSARMNCTPAELGQYLPGVLTDTRHLWYRNGDRDAGQLLVRALVTGSLGLKPAGYIDLALRMAELADQVARAHGDPVCVAAAQFALAQAALAVGNGPRSARLAAEAVDRLDQLTRVGGLPPQMLNEVLAWMTMLHLHAALSEANLGTGDPSGRLAAADVASRTVVGNPWRMEATAANVEVWRIGITLETGNPDLVPGLIRRIDQSQLLTPQRKARMWLDAGRAAPQTGDPETAIRYLLRADAAAPGDLRQRPTAVGIVADLITTSRGSEELLDLANRVGVDPARPEPVA